MGILVFPCPKKFIMEILVSRNSDSKHIGKQPRAAKQEIQIFIDFDVFYSCVSEGVYKNNVEFRRKK